MLEEWKPINGYEGFYEVSNLGKIRSVDRVVIGRRYKGREMALQENRNKYLTVTLLKEGKAKSSTVHRLVCEAFYNNKENKRCVNHIDGDKHNNDVFNLEWSTHSENAKHAFRTGLRTISENNKKAASLGSIRKFSIPIVRSGNNEPNKRYPSTSVASKVEGINKSDITQVCKGKRKTAGGYSWNYENMEV
jgi:hypothetical protein